VDILTLSKNRFNKVIIIMIFMLTLIIPMLQPKKVQASGVALTQAGISLIEIILGAVGGQYMVNKAVEFPYGDLDAMYQEFYNDMSAQQQLAFVTALTTYETTKKITYTMIADLQLAYLSYKGLEFLKEQYNVSTPFSASDYNLIDSSYQSSMTTYNSTQSTNLKYVSWGDYLFVVGGISPNNNGKVKTLEAVSNAYKVTASGYPFGIGFQLTSNPISGDWRVLAKCTKRDSGVVASGTYYRVTTSVTSFTGQVVNITRPDAWEFPGTLTPAYDPAIGTADVPGEVSIPVDTVQTIPAYPIPANPADKVAVNIPVPVAGTPAIAIPVATTIPVAGTLDPTVPGTGIGTLDPSLPDGVALDFSPLTMSGLTEKFPFCIPFDMLGVFNIFASTNRTAPVFNLPFVYDIDLNFDLSIFNTLAAVGRFFMYLLFIYGLMILTKQVLF